VKGSNLLVDGVELFTVLVDETLSQFLVPGIWLSIFIILNASPL
jgi:hypothetical protein